MSHPATMINPPNQIATDRSTPGPGKHNGWLLIIGFYNLLKAALFFAIGIGAIRLVHKDIVDVFTRAVLDLRFDPEGRFISMMLDKLSLVNDHRLRQISAAVFAYSALSTVEGLGLMFERTWAEYLTLVLTASFLPWEFFEIAHRITGFKIGLVSINLAMVGYLAYHVRKRARERKAKA